ncbi:MAG: site-specific integrase [Myxacorys californica WJT36-NPBG1]|jgi:integrase|nr:site-specific integrase [Myxacorys californica WJT36-NPBG1]
MKASKGTVQIRVVGDRLWLRWTWSKELSGDGKRFELALGLPDTPTNRKVAEFKAKLIEKDLANGDFDSSLGKYRPNYEPRSSVKVFDLFNSFINYKSNFVYKDTLIKYKALLNQLKTHFKQKTAVSIGEAEAVGFRDWLAETLAPTTVQERLTLLSACWEWGMKRNSVTQNPWSELVRSVKIPPKQKPNPFSSEEIRQIINGFRTDPEYSYYTDFVEFILGTGCRTGEAIALCWKHVKDDGSMVWIGESVTVRRDRKSTKTYQSRELPLTPKLAQLLLARKPKSALPDDAVFPSRRGKLINQKDFAQRPWTKVLEKLGVDYRRPYNSRHTMISHSIFEHGMNPAKVARLVGNDPKVLFKSYLGDVGDLPQLPDLLE